MAIPVMMLDSSEARKPAAAASFGRPMRPSGSRSMAVWRKSERDAIARLGPFA
jgi:hypothetical protein